ncbi:MAG: hypothetical protein ABMA64_17555 [Myxococcota bacterium]
MASCDGAPECVDVDPGCAPQFEPTWDAVYANTVSTSCALSACHLAGSGGEAAAGGLALGPDSDAAYTAVRGYVVPGDAACSELVVHLEPEGLGDMPPGAPLSAEERCAVRAWVDAGAPR